jgi:hypothetical protein
MNNVIPISDGAEFVTTAQDISAEVHKSTVTNFIKYVYFNRGWRPLIWSATASPFFYILNNQITISIFIVQTLHILILFYGCYSIANNYVIKERAILVSLATILVPWVFNISRDYFPDFAFFTVIQPYWFHLYYP